MRYKWYEKRIKQFFKYYVTNKLHISHENCFTIFLFFIYFIIYSNWFLISSPFIFIPFYFSWRIWCDKVAATKRSGRLVEYMHGSRVSIFRNSWTSLSDTWTLFIFNFCGLHKYYRYNCFITVYILYKNI